VELQGVYGELKRAGYALYAVSYDSIEVLRGFADRYGIDYPLLSDEGSTVIRSLGILNEQANENVFGIPHPGVFVLDGAGLIARKTFYPSYRERDTGAGLLEHVIGIASPRHGPEAVAVAAGVAVRAWLDADTYTWGQRVWLNLELEIPEGLHVYGRPIPDGYQPLAIAVAPIDRASIGDPEWPPPRPFRLDGLDEQFNVYEGRLRVGLPITFMVVDAGRLAVRASVSFQACTACDCLAPESVELVLPIEERTLIERPSR
jgi:hypothetical protein